MGLLEVVIENGVGWLGNRGLRALGATGIHLSLMADAIQG